MLCININIVLNCDIANNNGTSCIKCKEDYALLNGGNC